tara:strand:- start:627 stop:1121 length:495 start_codon:yes stop_codon:yes gene_type:complete
MRRLIFIILISFCFFSCSKKNKYEENLHHFKSLINDINIYFQDSTQNDIQIHNYFTEDFVFHSYPAGYKKGIETNKSDYIDGFNKMKDANMSINIIHSIYLPGIDETSYKIDGSVRVYYGAIIKMNTNSVEFSGYQTINFQEGVIKEIWEWSDYGGVKLKLQEK